MELKHMKAFIVLAEELNFHRAAEHLHIAQPALTQQIKYLERDLGVSLLNRTTRHVSLTAAGIAFLQDARRSVAASEAAKRSAQLAANGEIGSLRLGIPGVTVYESLILIASKLREYRPRVNLQIYGPAYSERLVSLLAADDIDAALLRLPTATPGMQVIEIDRHQMMAVLPSGHRLARQTSIELLSLRFDPIVSYPSFQGSTTYSVIMNVFRDNSFTPQIAQEAPDTHTMMLLVAAGVGIGIVPVSASHIQIPGISLVPIIDIPPLVLAIAWRLDSANPLLRVLSTVVGYVVVGSSTM